MGNKLQNVLKDYNITLLLRVKVGGGLNKVGTDAHIYVPPRLGTWLIGTATVRITVLILAKWFILFNY